MKPRSRWTKTSPEFDHLQALGDEGHEPVVVEVMGVEKHRMAVEPGGDLLPAVDHDRVLVERPAAGGGAVEPVIARRPHLLQAEDIGVAMGVEEGEKLLPAGAPAPGVETDELHGARLLVERKRRILLTSQGFRLPKGSNAEN